MKQKKQKARTFCDNFMNKKDQNSKDSKRIKMEFLLEIMVLFSAKGLQMKFPILIQCNIHELNKKKNNQIIPVCKKRLLIRYEGVHIQPPCR